MRVQIIPLHNLSIHMQSCIRINMLHAAIQEVFHTALNLRFFVRWITFACIYEGNIRKKSIEELRYSPLKRILGLIFILFLNNIPSRCEIILFKNELLLNIIFFNKWKDITEICCTNFKLCYERMTLENMISCKCSICAYLSPGV